MKQIQIRKQKHPATTEDIDRRTPSGRILAN